MTITRSMSNRNQTTAVDPPKPVDPPLIRQERRTVTRSTSNYRRPSKTTAVAPPPQPCPQKIRFRLMPFDLPGPACASKRKLDWLKKQDQRVINYVKHQQRPKKPRSVDVTRMPKIRHITPARHTKESRIEALNRLGVIWGDGPPKTRKKTPEEEEECARNETLTDVLVVVLRNSKLPQRDLISLLSVCRGFHNSLISMFSIWRLLDLHGMKNAGDRLVEAFSLTRYYNVVHINLKCAEDIEDKHLKVLNTKIQPLSLSHLQYLNLDGCQKISNRGVKDIASICPELKKFSICWNLRVTDFCIKSLVKNCKFIIALNLSGCKKLTDNSLVTIGNAYHELESLDITRCEQITDDGVIAIAEGCPSLQFLSLFGIPGVTNRCLETLTQFCSNTSQLLM